MRPVSGEMEAQAKATIPQVIQEDPNILRRKRFHEITSEVKVLKTSLSNT
jgi:polyhydroxyalkanoate synthesis regulator phasin